MNLDETISIYKNKADEYLRIMSSNKCGVSWHCSRLYHESVQMVKWLEELRDRRIKEDDDLK